MTDHVVVGDDVEFECSNGGVLKIIGDEEKIELSRFGADGFAYYDDLHLDAYNDMMVDVRGDYHIEGSIEHVTGDSIMTFGLSSLEPNGKVDVKLTGLHPDAWYRLHFGGVLAACEGGRAHGATNKRGELTFNKVEIPNE